jgi:hypothetical protein
MRHGPEESTVASVAIAEKLISHSGAICRVANRVISFRASAVAVRSCSFNVTSGII